MRLIDADALQYRRIDYDCYDDVSVEKRRQGIAYMLKEDIDNAPTIDPVKHGKWIPHEETTELSPGVKMTAKGYICSECGERFGYAWTWCGNCGAKMERIEDHD